MLDIPIYQRRLKLQEATFSRIDHEDAIVAIVFKVIQPDGSEFILKICDRKRDYFREVHFLNFFESKLPVPQVISLVPPEKDIHGAILMECLPGKLLEANEITESLARELGHCLALIHMNRLPGYGDLTQGKLDNDPAKYFTFKFKEGINECRNHLPSTLIEACQRYYEAHLPLVDDIDGPCIAHRDFRPGNIMVHQGKLQGIIDWAGARAGFAEEDFCPLEHVDWLGRHKKAFFSSYAEVRPVPNYTHLISFLRLNKAIATIGFIVKRGTWETRDKGLYQSNRQFLEILLKNDA